MVGRRVGGGGGGGGACFDARYARSLGSRSSVASSMSCVRARALSARQQHAARAHARRVPGTDLGCCQQRECTVGTWVGATVGRGGGGAPGTDLGQHAPLQLLARADVGSDLALAGSAGREAGGAACPISTG